MDLNIYMSCDFGASRKTLGMKIVRYRKYSKLYLSHWGYIEKVLRGFNIYNTKIIGISLVAHFILSKILCTDDDDIEFMSRVAYSSLIGSLIYAKVCFHSDLSHTLIVVNRFIAKPSKEHWRVVQWDFGYLWGTSTVYLQCGKRWTCWFYWF